VTDLDGRIAVVTGAGGGIGGALAAALASRGARVWLVGRKRARLDEVAEAVAGRGEARVHVADLTVDDDIAALRACLEADAGRVDVLVHAAGVIELGDVETASLDAIDAQYRTNTRAPYVLTRALLPLLRACRGQIVFVNSTSGLRAVRGQSLYAASKHALRALADSVRDEVNDDGVRVLSVFPGRTATPMQAALHEAQGQPYRPERLVQPQDVAAMVMAALTLPRTAEVTEIRIRPLSK
jgi:NADP-dependent 3-hydroxy acid dehydrogenase YdfG